MTKPMKLTAANVTKMLAEAGEVQLRPASMMVRPGIGFTARDDCGTVIVSYFPVGNNAALARCRAILESAGYQVDNHPHGLRVFDVRENR